MPPATNGRTVDRFRATAPDVRGSAPSHAVRVAIIAVVTAALALLHLAAVHAPAHAQDGCPYGYAAEHSVYFGPGAASGIPNHEVRGGCTIMDELMGRAPFAGHTHFVSHVVMRSTAHLLTGTLTPSEYVRVVAAAARSDVGRTQPVTGERDAPVERIGAVLFTVRDTMPTDPAGTLGGLADCDILIAEPSGSVRDFYGMDAAELATHTQGAGMAVPSIGISLDNLRNDLDGVVAEAEAFGANYVRFSGSQDWTLDDYAGVAAELNDIGAALAEHDITVAYHNHGWELEDLGEGVRGLDVLARGTDPSLVTLELDTYWAESVGASVVELIRTYPGRFELLHLKDLAFDDAGEPAFADVGEGEIDFAAIFAHGEMAGLEYAFIEHDDPTPDGVTSACNSMSHLLELTY